MSLPASEQRTLDGIAGALRVSEPRLASMFSMFSKLSKDDRPPLREQVSPGQLRWARLRHRLGHPAHRRRLTSSAQARGRHWLLIFSHVAGAAVLLGLLVVVLNSTAHASCSAAGGLAAGLMPSRAMSCQQHEGHVRDPISSR
jgi:hypothetical protein